MASRRGVAAPLLLLVLCCLVYSCISEQVSVANYAELVAAVNKANKNGLACNRKEGCLGEVVSAAVTKDIFLDGELPGLTNNAHLSVAGACTARTPNRCVIDGQLKHKVFTQGEGVPYGPEGKLELRDLIFQHAKGGVVSNTWSTVNANRCIFRNNINNVVQGLGFFGGMPLQTYANCRWVSNNGTAINVGGNKLGLAKDGLGLLVKRGIFSGNLGHTAATGRVDGGAVSIGGKGKAIFENTKFMGNSAVGRGGALHADQTEVVFRSVSFEANKAAKGGGAVSGDVGLYQNTTVSFCSSTFKGNSNSATGGADDLLFTNPGINIVTVHFCGTPTPPASVFPAAPLGVVTNGSGTTCSAQFCQ